MSGRTGTGRCDRCNARTAADNVSPHCAPCQRSIGTTRRCPPASFWHSELVARAVLLRDFGLIVRAARESCVPSATQMEMANWLGLSQAQVSRIESGRTPANDLTKLARWAAVLGAVPGSLWFDFSAAGSSGAAAPNHATLASAADSIGDPVSLVMPVPARASSRRVGNDEVDAVNVATQTFRRLDNRFGGGHGRSMVSAYLQTEIMPALDDARFERGTRPRFERAAAELFHLAGWMAYDVGSSHEGRAHLRRAFDLASSAHDDALAAEMLAAMSHQASFSRRADEAIDLAVAARRAAHRSGSPALLAESATLEAHGLALIKDARGCIAALGRADSLFAQATADNTPSWLSYFDRAYLSAKFAHALRDLGRPADAERFARDSLKMSDGYDRGRLFNTALLAAILAESGKIDEAVMSTREAITMAARVRSARVRPYLDDIGHRLEPFTAVMGVREILAELRAATRG